ncbi:MAG TPA: hypothetical protein VIY86_15320, partial [Pirellulaceae bacterium]
MGPHFLKKYVQRSTKPARRASEGVIPLGGRSCLGGSYSYSLTRFVDGLREDLVHEFENLFGGFV